MSWVSCGVDYPRLVEGRCDALLYKSTKPWDHAPGQLLLTEAGGVLRHRGGADYDPRGEHRRWLVAARRRGGTTYRPRCRPSSAEAPTGH